MKISKLERQAIKQVCEAGKAYGFGNMIAHLQTMWAAQLINKFNMSESSARMAAGGSGYPFKMQEDLMMKGEWDETGERYKQ